MRRIWVDACCRPLLVLHLLPSRCAKDDDEEIVVGREKRLVWPKTYQPFNVMLYPLNQTLLYKKLQWPL